MAAPVQIACPGDRLARKDEGFPGPGTYIRGDHICSSLVGVATQQPGDGTTGGLPLVSVLGSGRRAQDQVVQVGDTIMGRITRIRAEQASVEILCAGDTVLQEAYHGVIRKEVRRTVSNGHPRAQMHSSHGCFS